MTDTFDSILGGCRCDGVRFRIAASPLLTMACHCTGCRRMSASAFSLSAIIPNDAFSVLQGETAIGGLHGPTRHFFLRVLHELALYEAGRHGFDRNRENIHAG